MPKWSFSWKRQLCVTGQKSCHGTIRNISVKFFMLFVCKLSNARIRRYLDLGLDICHLVALWAIIFIHNLEYSKLLRQNLGTTNSFMYPDSDCIRRGIFLYFCQLLWMYPLHRFLYDTWANIRCHSLGLFSIE